MTTIHPACEACKGACCEEILLPLDWRDQRAMEYFAKRGERSNAPGYPVVILNAPCPQLVDGLCGCHEDRPAACADYPIGGLGCRNAIKRRRPDQATELLALTRIRRP
jgi:putative zinc- or iron-chelating protein